jgi:HSP20 family protein
VLYDGSSVEGEDPARRPIGRRSGYRKEVREMLVRFDPFRELDRMTAEFSRPARPWQMPMDAYRRGDAFVVHLDVPGVDPNTIDLTVEQNTLTVTGQRAWPRAEDDEVVVAERPQGTFSRQLLLGESLDTDRIAARYAHGVLTITLPVTEQSKARKVEIAHGGDPQVIEASSAAA